MISWHLLRSIAGWFRLVWSIGGNDDTDADVDADVDVDVDDDADDGFE